MIDFSHIKGIAAQGNSFKRLEAGGRMLWQKGRLPSGYQEVAWIQPGGESTDYVMTDFVPDNDSTIFFRFIPTLIPSSNTYLWGCGTSATNARKNLRIAASGGITFVYNSDTGSAATINSTTRVVVGEECEVSVVMDATHDRVYLTVDGETDDKAFTPNTNDTTNLYIFKLSNTSGYGGWKFIEFEYTDATHHAHFVPCYRRADNKIGLYDLVNAAFVASNGNFTKGQDVA